MVTGLSGGLQVPQLPSVVPSGSVPPPVSPPVPEEPPARARPGASEIASATNDAPTSFMPAS